MTRNLPGTRALLTLASAGRHLNFTKAANEVGLTPAAVSYQIKEIEDFEWGTDNSPEKISQGYTHCFLVTFKSEADRDAYLPHKAHQAFVTAVKPLFDKVLVVDYWAKG